MKIGHFLIGFAGLAAGWAFLGFLGGDPRMLLVLGALPVLLFLAALGLYDVLDRSLGEALLRRPGDAALDDALYQDLLAARRGDEGTMRPARRSADARMQARPVKEAGERPALSRTAQSAGPRGRAGAAS
jgi:hypothetical protein